jgi:hypothetical protein
MRFKKLTESLIINIDSLICVKHKADGSISLYTSGQYDENKHTNTHHIDKEENVDWNEFHKLITSENENDWIEAKTFSTPFTHHMGADVLINKKYIDYVYKSKNPFNENQPLTVFKLTIICSGFATEIPFENISVTEDGGLIYDRK